MNLTKTSKGNKINIETTLKIYPKLINLYLKATSVKFAVNFWTNEHISNFVISCIKMGVQELGTSDNCCDNLTSSENQK